VLPEGAVRLMPWQSGAAKQVRQFSTSLFKGKVRAAMLCSVSMVLQEHSEPVIDDEHERGSSGALADRRPAAWRRVVATGPMLRPAEFKRTDRRMFLLSGNTTQNWTRIDEEAAASEARIEAAWS